MALSLVHNRECTCWPWGLDWLEGKPVQYATCRTCLRDVAQPRERAKETPVCIYCALDSGLLPALDEPLT